MRVDKIDISTSFNGIKLSRSGFSDSKEVVDGLKFLGAKCSGYKCYLGDYSDINRQAAVSNYIREHYNFAKNEFGVVHFPQTRDTYIIGNKLDEFKIFDTVKILDEDACMNWRI